MPIDNLNNGLLNGMAGSYGTPKVIVPALQNTAITDRKRLAVAFSDFWGSLGDFSSSGTIVFNPVNIYSVDYRDKESTSTGIASMALSSNAVLAMGIRKGTDAGAIGNGSLIRPFHFEISYTDSSSTGNASNNYTIYVGIDNQIGNFPTQSNFNGSGVWFEYNYAVNSGNWQVKASLFTSAFGFVNLTFNTNVPISISISGKNLARRLKLIKNAYGDEGTIQAFIDDVLVATIYLDRENNIYQSHAEVRVILRKTASTGVTDRFYVDYMYYAVELPKQISDLPT